MQRGDQDEACSGDCALCVGLMAVALPACSSSSPPPPIGIVADSGFRPGPDGFTFQNYGDVLSGGAAPTNLTPADVQTLFGNDVCADAAIGRCDLIPEAQAWMDETNQQMAGGHCFGFSVAADLVWQNKVDTTAFGAPSLGA